VKPKFVSQDKLVKIKIYLIMMENKIKDYKYLVTGGAGFNP
jgi:hypothetical protein